MSEETVESQSRGLWDDNSKLLDIRSALSDYLSTKSSEITKEDFNKKGCKCGGNCQCNKKLRRNENKPILDTVPIFRITSDFSEEKFSAFLGEGVRFNVNYSVFDAYRSFVGVEIFNPKTQGEARPGDVVIKVDTNHFIIAGGR
jgi:hypothetical protein